jgi:hypothetical protein
MRKTIAVAVVGVLALSGCNFEPDGNFPEPVRTTASPTTSPSAIKSEAPATPTKDVPQEPEPTKEEPKPEPTSATTSSAATTPAVQFAKRWGEKYPTVPEYAILKAANGVCAVTEQFPDWTNNPLAKAGIDEIVKGFGISESDGVAFTQDAQQNYCGSVSNPT